MSKPQSQTGLRLFFDIETLPPERDDTLVPARAQENEEAFRLLALDGNYGRLLCIGIILEQAGGEVSRGVIGRDKQTLRFHLDERRTLRAFWHLLRDFQIGRDLLIGHNIMEFDLPFIYKRSRINRVRPSVNFSFARYRSAPIYDTMKEWALWKFGENVKLSCLASLLAIPERKFESLDGNSVYDEYLAGHHERIAEYCLRDVEVVRRIYYRLTFRDLEPPVSFESPMRTEKEPL